MNPIPTPIFRIAVLLMISFGSFVPAAEPTSKPNIVFTAVPQTGRGAP